MITPIDVLCLAMFVGYHCTRKEPRSRTGAGGSGLCVRHRVRRARGLRTTDQYIGTPSWSFLLLVGVMLGLTALLGSFVSRRLKVQVTPLEATIGALIGLVSAAVLSFILFDWLAVRYGPGAAILKDSVMAWQLHDFAGYHALVDLSP